jgi:PAS domain S-box-containing protein
MPADPDPNGPHLPKILRDLVALSAVSSLWAGRDSHAIATDLADLLATLLNLDFAFVRLCDSDGNGAVEVSRGTAAPTLVERLQHYRDGASRLSRAEVVAGIGDGGQRGGGLVLPLGVNAEFGLIAAASARPYFPSEIDQLLLSVAAGHGATAFKMARVVEEHQRAVAALATSERELRQAHDELETKVAERTAELRRSDAYLAEAHKLSHTGTWAVKNLNGELAVVHWSDESYRIYGLDPRQGLPSRAWVWHQAHPDDRDRLYAETEEAQRQKKDFEVEFRILLRDGTVKYVEAIGHHVFSSRGELLEILGTHVDVTERKRSQEALRESEAKFRDYAESASDWFWESARTTNARF